MDNSVDRPAEPRQAARAGAQNAASAQALAARVRELETVLAVERAENAKRLREVDGHMRVMRTSLGDLTADFRRLSEEREQLRVAIAERDTRVSDLTAKLEQTRNRVHDEANERESAAASAVAAAIERAQAAEIGLAAARERLLELEEQLLEARAEGEVSAEHRIRDLERRVNEREVQLVRAADMLDRYERKLERTQEKADAAARVAQALSAASAGQVLTRVEVTSAPEPSPVAAPPAPPAKTAQAPQPAPAPTPPTPVEPAESASDAESDTFEPGDELSARPAGRFTAATEQAKARTRGRRRRRGTTGGSESVDDLLLDDTDDEMPMVHRDEGRSREGDGESGDVPPPRRGSPSRVKDRPHAAAHPDEPEAPPAAERLPDIEGVEVEHEVSSSPAGAVYFGRVLRTRRPVLVQMLPGRLAEMDESALDRLIATRHPNLVATLSYGECVSGPYVVRERPEGETADHVVRRGGALAEAEALAVVRQAARGLTHAADRGYLHGDLRPWALCIGHGSHVLVAGVGTTVVAGPARRPAASPAFAAPERLNADGVVDHRSDIYSLGAVLYYLLTGREPFEGDAADVVRRDPDAPCPDPRVANEAVSAHAAAVVAQFTYPDPTGRPAGWHDALAALELAPANETEPQDAGPLERAKAWLTANPLVALAAALLPLVALLTMFLVLGPGEPTARDRFDAAALRAESLRGAGDVNGARQVYAAFLTGTGDPDVEREAAARIDELYR